MAIFKSSTVWVLLKFTVILSYPREKNSHPSFDHTPGRDPEILSPIGFRNDSAHKHVIQEYNKHTRCISHSTILLKVRCLGNFIFCELHNEMIHRIVTVLLGVDSLIEKKKRPTMHLCEKQTPIISSCSIQSVMHGDCVYTRHMNFDCWHTQQIEVCLVCEKSDVQTIFSFTKATCNMLPA